MGGLRRDANRTQADRGREIAAIAARHLVPEVTMLRWQLDAQRISWDRMRESALEIAFTDPRFEKMHTRYMQAAWAEQINGRRVALAADQGRQAPAPGPGGEAGSEGHAPGGSEGAGDGPESDRQGPGEDDAEGRRDQYKGARVHGA
eukprot:15447396-Alexandrium_andersonii.AAC.1